MPLFHITVYLNVGPDEFTGLKPGDPLATDADLQLTLTADPDNAAARAYVIGNRLAADDQGRRWPSDVRSMTVGDLLRITCPPATVYRAVCIVGFHELLEPANPTLPLAGTRATSRRPPAKGPSTADGAAPRAPGQPTGEGD
jgi:hypothetical protein